MTSVTDPRVLRSRRTILDTASTLLVEGGLGALTMDAVAARSGVAKTTIYRHWASRTDLLEDVFLDLVPGLPDPEPDESFLDALHRLVDAMIAIAADDRWKRIYPALVEYGASLEAEPEDGFYAIQRRAGTLVVQRGIDQGVLPADTDVDEAFLQLLGPFVMASLDRNVETDPAFGRRMIELFLRSRGVKLG